MGVSWVLLPFAKSGEQRGADRNRRRGPVSVRGWLRRRYMQTTSASKPWEASRRYVRVLYALWAPFYDWTISWDPAYRSNAARMVDATVPPGDRVLDVGTGTGLLAVLTAPRASIYVVLSSFMLPHVARSQRPVVLREMRRVLSPGGRLGLFLARGEVAPLFPTSGELEDDLAAAGFEHVEITDRDDVYRIVTAR